MTLCRMIALAVERLGRHPAGHSFVVGLAGLEGALERGPSRVPACAALPALAALRDPLVVMALSEDLHWRQPGFGRLPEVVAGRMAVVELAGPDGMLACDTCRVGLLLQESGVDYPSHRHAAEELYLILGGGAEWQLEGGPYVRRDAGEFVHHLPRQSHAMRTSDGPMLALWGWWGDIGADSYST